jgi:hypothetical protein
MPMKPPGRAARASGGSPRSPMSSAESAATCGARAPATSPRSGAGSDPRPRCGPRRAAARPRSASRGRREAPRAPRARGCAGRLPARTLGGGICVRGQVAQKTEPSSPSRCAT